MADKKINGSVEITGKLNPNSSGWGINLPSTSALTSDIDIATLNTYQSFSHSKSFNCNNGNQFGYLNDTLSQLNFYNTDVFEDDEYLALLGLYKGSSDSSFRIDFRDNADAIYPEDYTLDLGTDGFTIDFWEQDYSYGYTILKANKDDIVLNKPVTVPNGFKSRESDTYKLFLPLASTWTANKTIATTDDIPQAYRHDISLRRYISGTFSEETSINFNFVNTRSTAYTDNEAGWNDLVNDIYNGGYAGTSEDDPELSATGIHKYSNPSEAGMVGVEGIIAEPPQATGDTYKITIWGIKYQYTGSSSSGYKVAGTTHHNSNYTEYSTGFYIYDTVTKL